MSTCEDTLTSIFSPFSTILVTVRTISPLTLPFTYSLLMSLTHTVQYYPSLSKVKRTYSKSLEDIIRTFL